MKKTCEEVLISNRNVKIFKHESYLLFLAKAAIKILLNLTKRFNKISYTFSVEKNVIDIYKEESIPTILNIIHNSIVKNEEELQSVFLTFNVDNKENNKSQEVVFELISDTGFNTKLKDLTLLKKYGNWYKMSNYFFDDLYISKDDLQGFKNSFEKLDNNYSKIIEGYFPEISTINNYLDEYIEFIRKILIAKEYIYFEDEFKNIAEKIMNFGLYNENLLTGNNPTKVSLYNPFMLYSLKNMYAYIYHYVYLTQDIMVNGEFTKVIIDDWLLEKISRKFIRYTRVNRNNYIINFDNYSDDILLKSFENIGSIEHINPIVVFDEIKNYIERLDIKNNPLKIAIIGDVFINETKKESQTLLERNFSELSELINYYNDSYLKKQRNVDIEFAIFNIDIFSKTKIQEVINDNDLIFMLDSSSLYGKTFSLKPLSSLGQVGGSLKSNTDYMKRLRREKNTGYKPDDFIINQIYNVLFILAYNNEHGYCTFESYLNGHYYTYVEEMILQDTKKEGIIYVPSDLNYKTLRLKYLSINKQFHNDKEVDVVRLSLSNDKQFKDRQEIFKFSDSKSIKFTLTIWDIIKNIDIRFKDSMKDYILTSVLESNNLKVYSYKIIKLLTSIIVTLDFKSSNDSCFKLCINRMYLETAKEILVSLGFSNEDIECFDSNVKEFLKYICEILLKKTENEIYLSLKESICICMYEKVTSFEHSFIYSLICKDMLNGGIGHNCEPILNGIENIRQKRIEDILKFPFQSKSQKESTIYNQMLSMSKMYSFRYATTECIKMLAKYTSTFNVRENIEGICRHSKIDYKDLFRSIKKVCEKYNYTNSVLYHNVLDVLN